MINTIIFSVSELVITISLPSFHKSFRIMILCVGITIYIILKHLLNLFSEKKGCFLLTFIPEQNMAYKINFILFKINYLIIMVFENCMKMRSNTYFLSKATTNESRDAAALTNKIEVLVASIKRRSQRLYKYTDSNKGHARIRRKIREEKGILTSVVEKYNRVVPSTETLCMETILSRETAWPWQLPHSGRYTSLLNTLANLTYHTPLDFIDHLNVDLSYILINVLS